MKKLTYKKAGVDINKANLFIQKITPLIKNTRRPGWVTNIGAFAGFFKAPFSSYKDPLLVASTDGVGTKLTIACLLNRHDTIGIDLVAMCVNDLVACGAEPLFFLDYFATGKLSLGVSCEIIKGIVKGCKISNCALIGGETAELPGLYQKGDYDMAGFTVGIVDRKSVIDGSGTKPGDLILGVPSSGIHSNGYSLVRKVFSKKELKGRLGKEALTPTTIYVKPILDIAKNFHIKGIAHITGGGFYDNIIRILPHGTAAIVYTGTWPVLPIFKTIQKKGNIDFAEMFRTFNMGIGMTLSISREEIFKVKSRLLKKHGLKSWIIGEIVKGDNRVEVI